MSEKGSILQKPELEAQNAMAIADQRGPEWVAKRQETITPRLEKNLLEVAKLIGRSTQQVPTPEALSPHFQELTRSTRLVAGDTINKILYGNQETRGEAARQKSAESVKQTFENSIEAQRHITKLVVRKLVAHLNQLQREIRPYVDFARSEAALKSAAGQLSEQIEALITSFARLSDGIPTDQHSDAFINSTFLIGILRSEDFPLIMPNDTREQLLGEANPAEAASIEQLLMVFREWLTNSIFDRIKGGTEENRLAMLQTHELLLSAFTEFSTQFKKVVKAINETLQDIQFLSLYRDKTEISTIPDRKPTHSYDLAKLSDEQKAEILTRLQNQSLEKSQRVVATFASALDQISSDSISEIDSGASPTPTQTALNERIKAMTGDKYDLVSLAAIRHDDIKKVLFDNPSKQGLTPGTSKALLLHDALNRDYTKFTTPQEVSNLGFENWVSGAALVFPTDIEDIQPIAALNPSESMPSRTGSKQTVLEAVSEKLINPSEIGRIPDLALQITLKDKRVFTLFFNTYYDPQGKDNRSHFAEFVLIENGQIISQDRVPSIDYEKMTAEVSRTLPRHALHLID